MPTTRGRTLPVLLAAVTLVGGANLAAYAANGDPLLLGSKNTASAPTTLTTKRSGPALSLQSKPGSASLAVSSTAKVARLNADRVDGLEAADLRSPAYRYFVPSTTAAQTQRKVSFPGLPSGLYEASYSITSSGSERVRCWFGDLPAYGFSVSSTMGGFESNNGSVLFDATTLEPTLTCLSTQPFNFYSQANDVVSQVSFTRVDSITNGTPTLGRGAHREALPGEPTSPR